MLRVFIIMALSVFSVFAAADDTEPAIVKVKFDRSYAPLGFDSNDHIQFVGEGALKSTCYRPAAVGVKVERESHKIVVAPTAYEYQGACAEVLVPFEKVVDVGILAAGTWTIQQEADGKKIGEISVKPATIPAADDYSYAPVSQAMFQARGEGGIITISGEFVTDCMKIKEMKTAVEKEALVLQPIVETEQRNDCAIGYFPYKKSVSVRPIPNGRYLLHVRSLNGKAINNLVQVH